MSFNFFSISFRRRISARQNTHPGLRKTHTTADVFCQISFPFILFILFGSSNRGASDTIVLVLAAAAKEEEEEDLFIIFSYGMKQMDKFQKEQTPTNFLLSLSYLLHTH